MDYYRKYIKYKTKYLRLRGGTCENSYDIYGICKVIVEKDFYKKLNQNEKIKFEILHPGINYILKEITENQYNNLQTQIKPLFVKKNNKYVKKDDFYPKSINSNGIITVDAYKKLSTTYKKMFEPIINKDGNLSHWRIKNDEINKINNWIHGGYMNILTPIKYNNLK